MQGVSYGASESEESESVSSPKNLCLTTFMFSLACLNCLYALSRLLRADLYMLDTFERKAETAQYLLKVAEASSLSFLVADGRQAILLSSSICFTIWSISSAASRCFLYITPNFRSAFCSFSSASLRSAIQNLIIVSGRLGWCFVVQ